jgi:hypothetical protein
LAALGAEGIYYFERVPGNTETETSTVTKSIFWVNQYSTLLVLATIALIVLGFLVVRHLRRGAVANSTFLRYKDGSLHVH